MLATILNGTIVAGMVVLLHRCRTARPIPCRVLTHFAREGYFWHRPWHTTTRSKRTNNSFSMVTSSNDNMVADSAAKPTTSANRRLVFQIQEQLRRPASLLRPDPFGGVELHSAAECFIAQMRICDLRVRIVRDGHEPNEAEEQRPCYVPIEPVHVISSPKDRREQEGYQNSGSFGENRWGDLAGVNPLSFALEAIVAEHGHALPYRME
jgi:hypothetical protein